MDSERYLVELEFKRIGDFGVDAVPRRSSRHRLHRGVRAPHGAGSEEPAGRSRRTRARDRRQVDPTEQLALSLKNGARR